MFNNRPHVVTLSKEETRILMINSCAGATPLSIYNDLPRKYWMMGNTNQHTRNVLHSLIGKLTRARNYSHFINLHNNAGTFGTITSSYTDRDSKFGLSIIFVDMDETKFQDSWQFRIVKSLGDKKIRPTLIEDMGVSPKDCMDNIIGRHSTCPTECFAGEYSITLEFGENNPRSKVDQKHTLEMLYDYLSKDIKFRLYWGADFYVRISSIEPKLAPRNSYFITFERVEKTVNI